MNKQTLQSPTLLKAAVEQDLVDLGPVTVQVVVLLLKPVSQILHLSKDNLAIVFARDPLFKMQRAKMSHKLEIRRVHARQ